MTIEGSRSRWLFLRLLGLVYLIAFASLAVQIRGLIGAHGLLPAHAYLEAVHEAYGSAAYRLLPTIFWLGSGDTALHLAAWLGAASAVLLIADRAPRVALSGMWVLYLSLSSVGQDFLSFQWDAMLLEAGLLALLWAPPGWWRPANTAPPSAGVRWLLVFLEFKLMFLSGATKLLSGDPTWRHLTALDYHFETQPLPTWIGWYAHQLPSGLHRAGTGLMFVIELGAPWLLLVPFRFRGLRLGGIAGLALLQLGIAATGNYGFFNLLALVLLVPALDDRTLERLVPERVLGTPLGRAPQDGHGARPVTAVLVPVFAVLSVLAAWAELVATVPGGRDASWLPRWSIAVLGAVAPLRSFNGYGLFRVMTTERPEIVVEGSSDGREWREYDFRYKPGPVDRAPRFVEPYHPRLDWQMWFAALDPMSGAPLLASLARGLRAGTPAIVSLIGRNPFSTTPPRVVRFALYDYRFTTWSERRRTGAWWQRRLEGYLPEIDGALDLPRAP
ncbi:MAG: lipase maturation factor family protein [Gemmatimonadales bacterium]